MRLKQAQEFFESPGGLMFLMFACLVFFTTVAVLIVFFAPANDKAFLLFSNLISGCASSLWTAAQAKNKAVEKDKENQ
jgi:hypothetical protein